DYLVYDRWSPDRQLPDRAGGALPWNESERQRFHRGAGWHGDLPRDRRGREVVAAVRQKRGPEMTAISSIGHFLDTADFTDLHTALALFGGLLAIYVMQKTRYE